MSEREERLMSSGPGDLEYSIRVKETEWGMIEASFLDELDRFSSVLLALDEAQELASHLNEVAGIAKDRECEPGKTLTTAGQLRSAPFGTILLSRLKTAFTKTGSETLRGAAGYYSAGEAARVFGPFTVLYNPEVAE